MFAGFVGSNTLEEAHILMVGGCAVDTLTPLIKMHGVKEQDAKASTCVVAYIKDIMFPIWICVLYRITYFTQHQAFSCVENIEGMSSNGLI